MKIKHNKTKNVGLLFEIMANEIVRLAVSNDKNTEKLISTFQNCIQKNQIILQEYKIYKNVASTKCVNESQSYRFIDTIYNSAKLVDNKKLDKALNELYSEVGKYIPIKDLFSNKINNYKLYASVNRILNESRYPSGTDFMKIKNNVESTIIKHLLNENKNTNEKLINEDYNVDSLTFNIMVKTFNKRYGNIPEGQQKLIKDYIYFINDKEKMSSILKENCSEIQKQILENSNCNEKSFNTKIRLLNEKIDKIKSLKKNICNNENIEFLLECYGFIDKLKQWKTI